MIESVRFRTALVGSTVLALVVLIGLSPSPAEGRSTGANAGFAGNLDLSDGSPQTCAVCHSSFDINEGSGSLTVDVAQTVTPGEATPITITLDGQTPPASEGSARQGFEVTVRDPASGELWGRLLVVDANTQFTGQGTARDTSYVTHTLGGSAQSTWTVDWEPGIERSGIARIYVSANAADGNGSPSGDYVYFETVDVVVPDVSTPSMTHAAFSVGVPSPNPTRAGHSARIPITMEATGTVRVTVLDGLGRVVRPTRQSTHHRGDSVTEVDTRGLAAGLYFVLVEGPGGRQTQPIAVVR